MPDVAELEKARLQLGSWIVGGAITAVIVALIVIVSIGPSALSDRVALLGSITTFLGAVVGVFFGVNASGSAAAQSTAASAVVNQAAGQVADAAKQLSVSAGQVTESAARSVDLTHAVFRQAQDGGVRSAALSGARGAAGAVDAPGDDVVEMLAGDPEEPVTRLVIPTTRQLAFDTFARGVTHVGAPAAAQTLFGTSVVGVATTEADDYVSRDTNRPRVTEYLQLLGFPFADAGGVPVRYCAAGLTWAVCKAYCDLNQVAYSDTNRLAIFRSVLGDVGKYYFKPSAGCQVIMDDARARHSFIPASAVPKPGYLVFYNWTGHSNAEHIGLVISGDPTSVHTIEFNTTAADGPNQGNGGAVSRKVRPIKFVLGFAATYQ